MKKLIFCFSMLIVSVTAPWIAESWRQGSPTLMLYCAGYILAVCMLWRLDRVSERLASLLTVACMRLNGMTQPCACSAWRCLGQKSCEGCCRSCPESIRTLFDLVNYLKRKEQNCLKLQSFYEKERLSLTNLHGSPLSRSALERVMRYLETNQTRILSS